MMKWCTAGLMGLFLSLSFFSVHASINPAEQKFDKIMSTYAGKVKGAFQEQNDQKTMALLRAASQEAASEINKIKPELQEWAKTRQSLTAAERIEEKERFENKPYVSTMIELMFHPVVIKRIEANPALRQAMKPGESILTDFKI